jgi:hypothetical protein
MDGINHNKHPKILPLLIVAALVTITVVGTLSLANADTTDASARTMPDTDTLIATVAVVTITGIISVYLIIRNKKKAKSKN